ncbi:gypsy retrotransposon integrase-like protein 1 [Plakobranchus ocellatus]|uniref:Gypsy retrotransposon integrase-like protein 1 n=1 Tax=Plakobranchus ocellatus TaxID=259542 RepID=A0AAV4D0A5_9GAST|nr:gypsy retrotransposon integrase-like protein 1 [Plakobranchus ocellatus]
MKIELKKLELQPDKQNSPEPHSVLGGRPKIPPFNARDDEIDLFLERPNKPFGKIKPECVAFSAGQVDHTLSGADQQRGCSTYKNFSGGNSRNRGYSSGGYRGDRLQSPGKHNITCFTCGKKGHIQRECRSAKNGNRVEGQKPVTCYGCGGVGHFRSKCPSHKRDRSGGRRKSEVTSNVAVGTDDYFVPIVDELSCSTGVIDRNGSIELHNAVVNGVNCKLLRDTGCTCVGVRGSLVPDGNRTGRTVKVRTFLGHLESVPTAVISLDSKFFTGRVEACVLPNPVSYVILGNIVGLTDGENSSQQAVAMPAITRAQASKDQTDLSTNSLVDKQKFFPEFRTVNLTIEQRSDSTLKPWFSAVGNPPVRGISFDVEDGILFRIFQSSTKYTKTLVVPQSRRSQVLSMAHDSLLSGHTGFRKTLAHVKSEFSWPGLTSDVYQFVRSCHTCQIKAPVGRDRPALLQSMPPILEPFQRVVIDLVGPLPCTDSKNMYVLTLIDMATRWAEAVPLRSISSQHVAESLFLIFTRLGFPVEIQLEQRNTVHL